MVSLFLFVVLCAFLYVHFLSSFRKETLYHYEGAMRFFEEHLVNPVNQSESLRQDEGIASLLKKYKAIATLGVDVSDEIYMMQHQLIEATQLHTLKETWTLSWQHYSQSAQKYNYLLSILPFVIHRRRALPCSFLK